MNVILSRFSVNELMEIRNQIDEHIRLNFRQLDSSVSRVNCSVRLYNSLMANRIKDFTEIKYYSEIEVSKFRNFGEKTMQKLKEIMGKLNIKFKENE